MIDYQVTRGDVEGIEFNGMGTGIFCMMRLFFCKIICKIKIYIIIWIGYDQFSLLYK